MVKPPAKLLEDAISQIKSRRLAIVQELREIDDALTRYGIDPRHLANTNGRTLVQGGNGNAPASVDAEPPPRKSRIRRAAPPLDWLVETLSDGKCAQPELVRRASAAGFSHTAAVALLKKDTGRFRSERAPRQAGVRGNPAVIWSLRR